jgi:predicted methyltransferase
MYARGDLEGQKIIILGDDDLTSIALALTGLPKEISVLEIDERILNFINQVAKDRRWHHLKAYKYDVRDSFPAHLSGQYDTFFTDPVETLPGLKLFLSRCAEALKGKESAGYLGLTHLEASRQKWYSIQKMFLEMGFVITELIYNFHSYDLERTTFIKRNYPVIEASPFDLDIPEVNWYTSNLIRLEAVQEPRPLTRGNVHLGSELYFDDEAYATLPLRT